MENVEKSRPTRTASKHCRFSLSWMSPRDSWSRHRISHTANNPQSSVGAKQGILH